MTLAVNIVGAGEIAQRAGVAKATVWSWQKRHSDFPAPHQLEMGPVWDWVDVATWLQTKYGSDTRSWQRSSQLQQLEQEA
jgi:predicted DNA-binding transcriptional regulator AlpA